MLTSLPDRLKPFQFTSESAREAAKLSAAKRRKINFKAPLYTEVEKEGMKFRESRLKRVRKQMLQCDAAFDTAMKRYKPDVAEINRIIAAQDRLIDLERKLSGQPAQPKTTSDPVKSDIPDV